MTRDDNLQEISKTLQSIRELQDTSLIKKENEIEQLRGLLYAQQDQLRAKEEEIRRLERERLRQQEERALELRSLFKRSAITNNPYQQNEDDDCYSEIKRCTRRLSLPRFRLIDGFHSFVLLLLILQFWQFKISTHQLSTQPQIPDTPSSSSFTDEGSSSFFMEESPPSVIEEKVKPWDSIPPQAVKLMSSKDATVLKR